VAQSRRRAELVRDVLPPRRRVTQAVHQEDRCRGRPALGVHDGGARVGGGHACGTAGAGADGQVTGLGGVPAHSRRWRGLGGDCGNYDGRVGQADGGEQGQGRRQQGAGGGHLRELRASAKKESTENALEFTPAFLLAARRGVCLRRACHRPTAAPTLPPPLLTPDPPRHLIRRRVAGARASASSFSVLLSAHSCRPPPSPLSSPSIAPHETNTTTNHE
jgi:hypothetical protein